LIFRFALDNTHQQSPATRVVNCYHGLDVDSTSAAFPNRVSVRKPIWSGIATVWEICSKNPTVNDPDVVVDVYDLGPVDGPQQITWRICHEDLYNDYIALLLPLS
jgi:hypothetical protein